MITAELTQQLKAEALRLGFDRVGIAPAVSPPGLRPPRMAPRRPRRGDELHGEARGGPGPSRRPARRRALGRDGQRSSTARPESGADRVRRRGKIARYARGQDYHRVLWDRLELLLAWLRSPEPGDRGRAVVDTAPLLERDFARLAGLGWIGKNTMLIDRRLGSFTVLGALLVDCELVPDPPHQSAIAGPAPGACDACPTDAFAGPYQLDASRCISYWTIEHRGPIADEFADRLDGWVFGCDICQDVCPWNRKAPAGRMPELRRPA